MIEIPLKGFEGLKTPVVSIMPVVLGERQAWQEDMKQKSGQTKWSPTGAIDTERKMA